LSIIYADRFGDPSIPATDTLALPYEVRCRRRQHGLRLPSGEEFGYHLPPGARLRNGDKLVATDGVRERVVAIVAAREDLLEVRAGDALQLARAAYHLGNRHVALEVDSDDKGPFLRMQPDHVLEDMLLGLGCLVQSLTAPFQPEGGAYEGHGHSHVADHHGEDSHGHAHKHGPSIHEFR